MPNSNQKTTLVVMAVGGVVAAAAAYFMRRRNSNNKPTDQIQKEPEENQVIEKEKTAVSVEEVKVETVKEVTPVMKKEDSVVVEEQKVEKVEKPIDTPVVEKEEKPADVPVVEKVEKPADTPVVEKVEKPVEQPVKKSSEFVEYYNAAKSLFNAQDYENALINFDKSIESSPKNNSQMKTLIYSRASCLKKLNRMEESLEAYNRCIELDPKYVRAYRARCGVYKMMNNPEKAMEDISFAYLLETIAKGDMIPAFDETEELINALAAKKAREEMDRRYDDASYVRHLPNSRFVSFYFDTLMSEKMTEYNTSKLSMDELKERIDKYSKESEKEYTLGDLYLMYGGELKAKARYDDALVAFTEACKEENECKDLFSARLEKATLINLTGNNREAVKIYEELYNDPEKKSNVNLLVKYASCLLELGDDKYHAIFDEAVELNPSSVDGYFHRGQLLFIENDIPRALADLNKVVQINNNHAMAYVQIAFCYLQMGNTEMALQNIKRAIACGVNKVQVQNHYGELLMSISRMNEAEAAFKKALEYDVRWPYTYVNLASLVLQTKQDCLSASNYYKKAIKIDPGCVSAMLQLAQLHVILQEFDEATSILKNALDQAITENDIKQTCSMMIGMEYQVRALEQYQQMLKNEGMKYSCLFEQTIHFLCRISSQVTLFSGLLCKALRLCSAADIYCFCFIGCIISSVYFISSDLFM